MWFCGPFDVEGELDATSYREKVTCWKKESLFSAFSHPVWQTLAAVSCNVREALRHFRRFLMEVPRDSCKVGKLARLVWCNVSGIGSEFDVRIHGDAWSELVQRWPTSASCILWHFLGSHIHYATAHDQQRKTSEPQNKQFSNVASTLP